MTEYIGTDAMRQKVTRSIDKYLKISKNQSLTVGFYFNGKRYVFSNSEKPEELTYDIGSISKTVTAHLILSLADEKKLSLDAMVSDYIDLPKGSYPTVYELLTHTAGYGHLTPVEITVPALLRHGYARRNIYENCTSETVIRALSRRKKKREHGYSYSDFPFAILAVVAEKVMGKSFSELIENFVQNDLDMKNTHVTVPENTRSPRSAYGQRIIDFWKWEKNNPYVAGGGLVSTVSDMLTYVSTQVESDKGYIKNAHRMCEGSVSEKSNTVSCIGWHTYKKSNQLWHVGGVGTFRSSVIINKQRRIGVVVLGNSKGVSSANVHYLAKMLYSEMKIRKINFGRSMRASRQK